MLVEAGLEGLYLVFQVQQLEFRELRYLLLVLIQSCFLVGILASLFLFCLLGASSFEKLKVFEV